MVSATIALRSSTGDIAIVRDENGVGDWSHVCLQTAASRALGPLGAERLVYIATRLSEFLGDTSPGERWVLGLSEQHTSMYGEHVDGGVLLRIQDRDARMFATLALTAAEKSEWLNELSKHFA